MTLEKTRAITIAVSMVCSLAVSHELAAQTAPVITYVASGTFASTPISGDDTLKLAGEPFAVTIVANSSDEPYEHGPNWAAFHQLKLTGTVYSGLLGATPISIASNEATIIQAFDPSQYDIFTTEAPINVVGIAIDIKAVIIMPFGTFSNPLLHPFAEPITLAPSNATLTYSDTTNTTVLAIQTGTFTATTPSSDVSGHRPDRFIGSTTCSCRGCSIRRISDMRFRSIWVTPFQIRRLDF